jgi:serine O-acetyltransferase
MARHEPVLGDYLERVILGCESFPAALAALLAHKLGDDALPAHALRDLMREIIDGHPDMALAALADLRAVCERDPAAGRFITPFLYFKGYQGLQAYRLSHALWGAGRTELARYLQSRISERFGMDIHPAARIGRGVMIDHGTGLVIGETAVVDDDVSMLHSVTLGGTGKARGDRHPKVHSGVLLGAGATVLGNIVIGRCAKVGAGSVVLGDVPPHCTVVGVPAQLVSGCAKEIPARCMNHCLERDRHT